MATFPHDRKPARDREARPAAWGPGGGTTEIDAPRTHEDRRGEASAGALRLDPCTPAGRESGGNSSYGPGSACGSDAQTMGTSGS